MPVEFDYQLYDFAPVGAGLLAAVTASVNSIAQPVQTTLNFPSATSQSPSVNLTFTIGAVRQNKHIIVPTIRTELQPYDSYDFTLAAEISTQREQSGVLHGQIVGKTRMALQLYKLMQFGLSNPEWFPYHTIRDIGELTGAQLSTDDTNTIDSTTLNFTGWLQIDPDAWPTVSQN